jgi:hypothetical protein
VLQRCVLIGSQGTVLPPLHSKSTGKKRNLLLSWTISINVKIINTKGLIILMFSQVLGVNQESLIHSVRPCNTISGSWEAITSRDSDLSEQTSNSNLTGRVSPLATEVINEDSPQVGLCPQVAMECEEEHAQVLSSDLPHVSLPKKVFARNMAK